MVMTDSCGGGINVLESNLKEVYQHLSELETERMLAARIRSRGNVVKVLTRDQLISEIHSGLAIVCFVARPFTVSEPLFNYFFTLSARYRSIKFYSVNTIDNHWAMHYTCQPIFELFDCGVLQQQIIDPTGLQLEDFVTLSQDSNVKSSPVRESLVLHVDCLTRNVHEGHLKEIFGTFGEIVNVELAMDRIVNLPRGFAYVKFKTRVAAEKALSYMDGAQIDGNIIHVKFTLPPRQKLPSPPRPVASAPRKIRGSPIRRIGESPIRRRVGSPNRRGESPPPRRRPASPPARGRSPSPRRNRSPPPRGSPRKIRGSPIRRRSPPLRRRSPPRRARSPPRRSPIRRRSRSPILRPPARSLSRSISPRRGRAPPVRRGRSSSYSGSPSPPRKIVRKMSRSRSPRRKSSPVRESLVLHVDCLTRNVNEGHLKEIFGTFGEIVNVELAMDRIVNLPRGFAYVEFKTRVDAEKALSYMDGAQIDGNVIHAKFTLPPRQKLPSPPRPVASAPKKDVSKSDNIAADIDKDGLKRPRENSPRRKPLSPVPRRSPVGRRASPRRLAGSPPRRRGESPIRRRVGSPNRRGESPPPRRRPASPPARGRSPSPRRNRSPPRGSPRKIRGSPIRRRSPPLRRRSPPRRARSPSRRSPIRRRSRSPIRRPPARSLSRSISPRRGRAPPVRRGKSSSYSGSPSPPRKIVRKMSRSRSPRRPLRRSSSSSSPPPPRKP